MGHRKCLECSKDVIHRRDWFVDGSTKLCKECSKRLFKEKIEQSRKKDITDPVVFANSLQVEDYRKETNKRIDKNILKRVQKYKITVTEYEEIVAKQKLKCAICGNEPSLADKVLNIDHNHKTGEVRGLLCPKCNLALGLFRVDEFGPIYLQSAIKYLVKNE